MSWISPLLEYVPPPPVVVPPKQPRCATNNRSVTINGVKYRSMLEARNKLGLRTYNQVYRLIGEGWRYRG